MTNFWYVSVDGGSSLNSFYLDNLIYRQCKVLFFRIVLLWFLFFWFSGNGSEREKYVNGSFEAWVENNNDNNTTTNNNSKQQL